MAEKGTPDKMNTLDSREIDGGRSQGDAIRSAKDDFNVESTPVPYCQLEVRIP